MEDFLNYRYYNAQDFFWDDSFRSWVLKAKPEDTLYWTRFMVHFPEKREEINLAIDAILQMVVKEPALSEAQINEIKEQVMQKIAWIFREPCAVESAGKYRWNVYSVETNQRKT